MIAHSAGTALGSATMAKPRRRHPRPCRILSAHDRIEPLADLEGPVGCTRASTSDHRSAASLPGSGRAQRDRSRDRHSGPVAPGSRGDGSERLQFVIGPHCRRAARRPPVARRVVTIHRSTDAISTPQGAFRQRRSRLVIPPVCICITRLYRSPGRAVDCPASWLCSAAMTEFRYQSCAANASVLEYR